MCAVGPDTCFSGLDEHYLMSREPVKRYDPLSPRERSAQMARVRATGNRSTEMRVAGCLIRRGIGGWRKHPLDITGRPDFCFLKQRVAVFVDGCFWHGCGRCGRNIPRSRRIFWRGKIEANRRRDRRVERALRSQGYVVVRIWEHALGNKRWMVRLLSVLRGAGPL